MVTESRPRRSTAVEAVKRVTKSLNSRPARAAPVAAKVNKVQATRKRGKAVEESENDSSELSEPDTDEEEEEGVGEGAAFEEDSTSESDMEADKTSDYEEGAKKRKRGAKVSQRSSGKAIKKRRNGATARKAPQSKTTKKKSNVGNGRARQRVNKDVLPIKEDNKLFNSISDGASDLQVVAQEWVEYYQDNPAMSLAQLVNCFFRCSACNATIDEEQVMDHDNVADVLDLIQVDMKTEVMPSYPLVSRSPSTRNFRRRLSSWVERLLICVDEADIVHDDTMMETLTTWTSAMSTSAVRSMRHTSTLVTLFIIEQLNRMSQANHAETSAAIKSRNAEKSKGSTNKVRLNDLNKKVQEANMIKKQLEERLQELFDTVFIHRYRDSDATIRSECIVELGRWMKKYPERYLQTSYLRYMGWSLSDMSEKVRLDTIRCLSNLYSRHEYEGLFQQFTERFLDRLVQMAVGDVDTAVRTATIETLTQIEQHGVLDEEAKDSIATHVFDVEPKVRSAVAAFIKDMLDGLQPEEEEEEEEEGTSEVTKMRWKHFAQLIVRLSGSLEEDETTTEANSHTDESAIALRPSTASRIAMAVGTVWDVDEKLQDWSALIQLLLYDHTHQAADRAKGRKRAAAAARKEESAPEREAYRLEVAEESLLLEALPVVLERTQTQSHRSAAKGQQEEERVVDSHSALTRDLVVALPKLFQKYKTEASRITEVLVVAQHLKMEAYLDYQQMGAFEALWDDVIDQFLRHVEPSVLNNAVNAMAVMEEASAMSNINKAKMSYLRQTVFHSLQECQDGVEWESSELDGEHLHALSACTSRLKFLSRRFDLCEEMERREQEGEEDDVRNGSPRDILLACAKRGSRGKKEEEGLVSDSIVVLALNTMWSARRLRSMDDGEEKVAAVEGLCTKRVDLLDVLKELLGQDAERTQLAVQRQAFRELVDLHILFAALEASTTLAVATSDEDRPLATTSTLRLRCDMETQEMMAAFVKSELSRYSEELEATDTGAASGEDMSGHDESQSQDARTTAAAMASGQARPSLPFLQRQVTFVSTISHFITAIRLGIVHVRFSVDVLSRHGRVGHLYDACLRVLVELLREVAIGEGKAEQACNVILDALWQAHDLWCKDGGSNPDTSLVNFAKMLSSSLVVRGAQLAVLKSIDGQAVMDMHRRGTRAAFQKLQRQSEVAKGGREGEEEGEEQRQVLVFFKVLSQLLISIGPREAIAIKKGMDDLIAEFGVEVPLTSKSWDPLRQYEKRLVTITSKSESVRKHVEAARSAKKAANRPKPKPSIVEQMRGEDGDEADGEWEEEGEGEDVTMEDSRLDVFGGDDDPREEEEHQLDLTLEQDEDEGEEEDDD